MKQGAVTLMELIIVIVIITVLSSIAWPNYTKARIRVENIEAFSILFLLQSAEKSYRLGRNQFYPLSGTGSVSDADLINNNLRVHLPVAGTRNWDYAVYDSGCVQVTRRNDFTRKWYLAITSFTPTSIIPCN